ncbi:MAG: hypothetical protein UY04_C0026G0004 [Parcubacteria group bacterium GW2011_GWA2_47_7]|nr:MAG: hypothetical protein UY04_C0026G0004 [Parcubacteria group bacterium GW2011_GWA2_47_7]
MLSNCGAHLTHSPNVRGWIKIKFEEKVVNILVRLVHISLLCFSAYVGAAPMDRGRAEMWCGKFFQGNRWHSSQDENVLRWSSEFLAKANIRATPIVCIGAPDTTGTAQSNILLDGIDKYFFVAFNADFRINIGGELRAIVAHEVAHFSANHVVHCDDSDGLSSYEACEHDVDQQTDAWSGRGTMARALEWTIRYIKERNGNDAQTIKLVRSVRRRIFLLK